MKRYDVEVSASNKINKHFDSMAEVIDYLENCQGRVSIIDRNRGYEIFNGNVETWNQQNQQALSSINKAAKYRY